ncbi:MAG TPA: phosphatidylinositol mannoside acyltransferase [Actinomycetota bacterium]
MMRRARLWLEGVGWLAAWRLARLVPERWTKAAFERMALRSYRRNPRRRQAVIDNLAPVVGEQRAETCARDAFLWYGRYWAETFRMEDLSSSALDARFSVDGIEHVVRAYEAGSGAVLATPHLGNWDSGGRWVAERWPLTAVVEVLRPQMLFDRFVAHRRGMGIGIVPLERGGDATGRCLEALGRGELVALVADRDLSGRGVEVKMFGRRTTMPPGAAVLALRAGAPLIAATIYQREDGTWQAWVLDPIPTQDLGPDDVAILTQRLAERFEQLIARAPEQWHVFSPYWTDA